MVFLLVFYFQILSVCKKGSSAPVSAPGGVLLIVGILLVMLLLLYCFHHEERLIALFDRYVVKQCFKRPQGNFRMKESFRNIVSWLTMVDKYREEAKPKTQTISIRFENLSLVLKKVTGW